jgi:hypothetical protein
MISDMLARMKGGTLEKKDSANTEETTPGALYVEAMQARPSTGDKGALLAELTRRLATLAQKAGLSVKDYLAQAESSTDFREDYLEALTTARQIARIKATP